MAKLMSRMLMALAVSSLTLTAAAIDISWQDTPLKVFILAGQSNMEGQAEVATTWPNTTCPHDAVQGPTNSSCYKNGTLMYQTLDPRTKSEFSKTRTADGKNWTVLPSILVYYQEGIGQYAHSSDPTLRKQSICPNGFCQTTNASAPDFCSRDEPLGGCGVWGPLSTGFGVSGNLNNIGPEYGFGFALKDDASKLGDEQILFIKVAYGGTTLCGDWRPPSSTLNNKTVQNGTVGHCYTSMVDDVKTVLQPQNLKHYFPSLLPRPSYEIAGFGWFQGWNDGCGEQCTSEYESNLVNLIHDIRSEFNAPRMPVSIAVSGFDGWGQKIPRRLGIIEAQFAAANATKHPEAQPAIAVETRSFWRNTSTSPSRQGYHWGHNAESYWLIGQAMGKAMVTMLNATTRKL